ncbi:MAG: hypothetical protein HKM94_07815 [Halobacteria archaeon]|nr:hypothetical protein [Halobacteria archaeon]
MAVFGHKITVGLYLALGKGISKYIYQLPEVFRLTLNLKDSIVGQVDGVISTWQAGSEIERKIITERVAPARI